jgi:hypothetical protein
MGELWWRVSAESLHDERENSSCGRHRKQGVRDIDLERSTFGGGRECPLLGSLAGVIPGVGIPFGPIALFCRAIRTLLARPWPSDIVVRRCPALTRKRRSQVFGFVRRVPPARVAMKGSHPRVAEDGGPGPGGIGAASFEVTCRAGRSCRDGDSRRSRDGQRSCLSIHRCVDGPPDPSLVLTFPFL